MEYIYSYGFLSLLKLLVAWALELYRQSGVSAGIKSASRWRVVFHVRYDHGGDINVRKTGPYVTP